MKDHKAMYGVRLRVGMFSSVVIFAMLLMFVPYSEPQPYELKRDIATIIEYIPIEIDHIDEPPPENRPNVVAEAADKVTDETQETIANTDIIEDPIRITPVGPDIEIVPYYKLEVKPKQVYSAVPEYPDLPLKAGIEGTTVVKMLVDIDGRVIDAKILKSSGNQLLDQAAITAAMKSTFTPAKQRDKFVRVWVSISMRFKLSS
jgi:protein TonB